MMRSVAWMTAAAIFLPSALAGAEEEITARPVGDAPPAVEAEATPAETGAFRRDAGWNSQWALHFVLHNVLQSSSILSGFDQSGFLIGGSYHLDSKMAVRTGLGIARSRTPDSVTKQTVQNGSAIEPTYFYNESSGGFSFELQADALMRLSEHIIAPYVGGGLFYEYDRDFFKGKDEVSTVNEIVHTNNHDSEHTLGVRGIVGAEWRIHPNFAFYAEYILSINLLQQSFLKNQSTTERTVEGVRTTSQNTVESRSHDSFDFATGIHYGPSFGLAVHFQ